MPNKPIDPKAFKLALTKKRNTVRVRRLLEKHEPKKLKLPNGVV